MAKYDPTDRESVKRRQDRLKAETERDVSALQKVLQTPEGRRVLWAILVRAGLDRRTFVPNSMDLAARVAVQDFVKFDLLPYVEQAESGLFLNLQREFGKEVGDGD